MHPLNTQHWGFQEVGAPVEGAARMRVVYHPTHHAARDETAPVWSLEGKQEADTPTLRAPPCLGFRLG